MDGSLSAVADRIGGTPRARPPHRRRRSAGLGEALATLAQQQRDQTRAIEAALSAAARRRRRRARHSVDPARARPPRALGYEAIEVVTRARSSRARRVHGALVVEARRGGTVHKGRAMLEDGVVSDVELRPAHLFP